MQKTVTLLMIWLLVITATVHAGLVDNEDGTVTDTTTGLMWQQATGGKMNWESALTYCESLSLAGHNDWRLPNANELQSLVDYSVHSPAIDKDYFPETMSSYYWSSTTHVNPNGYAWRVNFSYGNVGAHFKSNTYYVRAVRAGQSGSLDNLVISAPEQASIWAQDDVMGITWETLDLAGNVKILLSREGGKAGTFETIAESTENNGSYAWTVTGPVSANCMLKVEPLNDTSKGTYQGLFTIYDYEPKAFILNAPTGQTMQLEATPTVGGLLISHYQYKLDDEVYSDEFSVATPINLSGLADGSHTLYVIGKDAAGNWQSTEDPTTATWTVTTEKTWIQAQCEKNFTDYILTLYGKYSNDVVQNISNPTWSVSDDALAQVEGNLLTALKTGKVIVTAKTEKYEAKLPVYLVTFPDDMEMELNDTLENADDLAVGKMMQAEMLSNDTDFYQLTLAEDGVIDLVFLNTSSTADCLIQLLDADSSLVAERQSSNGEQISFKMPLASGDYYVKIIPAGDVDQNGLYYIGYWIKEVQELAVEDSVLETLHSSQDRYDFTLELSSDSTVNFILTPDNSNLYLQILNAAKETILSYSGSQEFDLPVGLKSGSYSVQVGHADTNDENSTFTLSLEQSQNTLEIEPNDDLSSALLITMNQLLQGTLLQDEVDYYAFTLNAPQFVLLSFSSDSVTADYQLLLYKGENQDPIDGINSTDGADAGLEVGLTAGTYYVKVGSGGDFENKSYYLTLAASDKTNLEIEPNHTFVYANALPKAVSKSGRTYSAGDMDLWGFFLPKPAMFSVAFESQSVTGDYIVSLLNAAGTVLSQKIFQDGKSLTLYGNQPVGTYYVRVEPGDDLDPVAFYTLTLDSDKEVTAVKKLVSLTVSTDKTVLSPDETTQLTVVANYSDATTNDVTKLAEFTSMDLDVLTIDATGLATALKQEQSGTIVVNYSGKTDKVIITVGDGVEKQSYCNLIIVAGGSLSDNDSLKDATLYVTDLAYQKFKARNFTDEDIYFITQTPFHDLDGDGYDDKIVDDLTPTVADIQSAVTDWGKEQPSSGPLYIYMADHGVKDTFLVATSEYFTAALLNASLDNFQKDTGRDVVLIIEACYSGSFVDNIQSDTYDRLIITSVDDSNPAYLSSNGTTSFSSFLMSYLYKGKSLEQSLDLAKADLQSVGLPYSKMAPQLQGDPSLLTLKVGGDFVLAGVFPEITGNTSDQSLTSDDTLSLYADVSSAIGGLDVWAVIVPPDYTPPSVTGDYDTPLDELPKVFLVDEDSNKILDGKYEGSYSDLAYNGVYKVIFYAKDAENNLVKTPPVSIIVTGGQDTTTTTTIPEYTETMIDMSSGWNLINSYLEPEDPKITSMFFGIEDQIVSIWKWDNGKWAVYLMGQEDGGAAYADNKGFLLLQEIHAGEGFWMNCNDSQYLTISGTEPSVPAAALVPGWNLVGLKSDQAKSITDLVGENAANIVSVWKWKDAAWAVYLPAEDDGGAAYAQSKGFSLLSDIAPGEGFWVNCIEAVTLD